MAAQVARKRNKPLPATQENLSHENQTPETLLEQLVTEKTKLTQQVAHAVAELANLAAQLESTNSAISTESSKTKRLQQTLAKRPEIPGLNELRAKLEESKAALAVGDLHALQAQAEARKETMESDVAALRIKLAVELKALENEKGEKPKLIAATKLSDKKADDLKVEMDAITGKVETMDKRLSQLHTMYSGFSAARDEVKALVKFCNESVDARCQAEEQAIDDLAKILEPEVAVSSLKRLDR